MTVDAGSPGGRANRGASRQEGLDRLAAFAPRMGRSYGAKRNYDLGEGQHRHVSLLSPYVRHRLVLERELVTTAIGRHGFGDAEKYIQEVCWRTYWKGWLEMRPTVWQDYRAGVRRGLQSMDQSHDRFDTWRRATSGDTGIECFDTWTRELVTTGYLHNHARMWYASIWVFTLRLPWTLGADFFLRHLLDGDAASNTLSWRWVAGMQTRGKTYLASPPNIVKYTRGRFEAPRGLVNTAPALREPPLPAPQPLPPTRTADPALSTLLLLHEDDLFAESLTFDAPVEHAAAIGCVGDRSPAPVSAPARQFTKDALADGLARAGSALNVPATLLDDTNSVDAVTRLVGEKDIRQVVTPWAPVGPAAQTLDRVGAELARHDIPLVRIRRDWDSDLWPHATTGFFAFKAHIADVLAGYGLIDKELTDRPTSRSRYLRRSGGRSS